MPAGHLHRRMMGGAPTFASKMAGYAAQANDWAHWPLNDASFSTTAGTLTELGGWSDNTEDKWFDGSTSQFHAPNARQAPIITGGSDASVMLHHDNGDNDPYGFTDSFELGDINGTLNGTTFLVWIAMQAVTATRSGMGNQGIVHGVGIMMEANENSGKNGQIELYNNYPPLAPSSLASKPMLFACVATNNNDCFKYLYHDGNRYTHNAVGQQFLNTIAGNNKIRVRHGLRGSGTGAAKDSYAWFQDAYCLNGLTLTQSQLDELYTLGSGVSV